MATFEVSGYTEEEVEERKRKYLSVREKRGDADYKPTFEEAFCLAKIPKQPDDYDGPQRYCMSDNTMRNGRCKHHGGAVSGNGNENLDKLARMEHGMYATRDHLVEDFDDKDQALYDWIVDNYAEAYDLDLENDPQAAYDMHRYAAEAVRAERGRGHLVQEGEIHEEEKISEEGNIVRDEDGNIVTEKSEHYLAKMLHRQDNKLTNLARELGITRKERKKQETTTDAVDAIQSFSEVGKTLLGRSDKEFNPEDEPWEE